MPSTAARVLATVVRELEERRKRQPNSVPPPRPSLTRNAARCRTCGTVLESTRVHDYVACPCGNAVDGGLEYAKRCGRPEDLEELCEWR